MVVIKAIFGSVCEAASTTLDQLLRDDDQEAAKMKELMKIIRDEEEIAIDAIPLATKPLCIIKWMILKEGKISYYQIIRADRSSNRYLTFIQLLKSFDREDLETLWKLVKAKHGSTRPEKGYERVLWGDQRQCLNLMQKMQCGGIFKETKC
ncbi:hypothetical protein Tco_0184087 [Tanacetum coccineum]